MSKSNEIATAVGLLVAGTALLPAFSMSWFLSALFVIASVYFFWRAFFRQAPKSLLPSARTLLERFEDASGRVGKQGPDTIEHAIPCFESNVREAVDKIFGRGAGDQLTAKVKDIPGANQSPKKLMQAYAEVLGRWRNEKDEADLADNHDLGSYLDQQLSIDYEDFIQNCMRHRRAPQSNS